MMTNKITDISKPLYNYWLLYRYDINGDRIVSNRDICVQKLKVFTLVICNILMNVRMICCLYNSEPNKQLPVYYFELFQFWGDFKQLLYLVVILGTNLGVVIVFILNSNHQNSNKWFEIIRVINGHKTPESIGLWDKYLTQKFINKTKFIYWMSLLSIKLILFMGFIVTLFIIKHHFDAYNLIIYGILSAMVFQFQFTIGLPIVFVTLIYYLMVCYYIQYRIQNFRNYLAFIQSNKALLKSKTLTKIMRNHNKLCLDIELHNTFWENMYFAIIYTMIPVNNFLIRLAIFEFSQFLYIAFLTSTLLLLLTLNLITSNITFILSALIMRYMHFIYTKLVFKF